MSSAQPNVRSEAEKSVCVTRDTCVFCKGTTIEEIIDFGEVALAGGFLKPENFKTEELYPLRLCFCHDCYAVQVINIVSAEVLFRDYFYFSSAIGSLREHFMDYATEVVTRFLNPAESTVVEFGCNDGVLLSPLADQGIRTVIGVDPATNVVQSIDDKRIKIVNNFFTEAVAEQILIEHGPADLIVANNVFAHIPDINGTTAAIRKLLKKDGVFIFEVHYLGSIIEGLQYDMIYHEHLYYYSLLSLMKHFEHFGMKVFDVKPISIHAGSMRYYVAKNESVHAQYVSPRVIALEKQEKEKGFDKFERFKRFASDIRERRDALMNLLTHLNAKGKSIIGYGASGRANTIIQYCGINHEHMKFMIDDAPAKEGYYTPGSHFLIRGNQALAEEHYDYLLLFAWGYFSEIAQKSRKFLDAGGRILVPLPEVRVILHPSVKDNDWL